MKWKVIENPSRKNPEKICINSRKICIDGDIMMHSASQSMRSPQAYVRNNFFLSSILIVVLDFPKMPSTL
jgi:hypothetical protein